MRALMVITRADEAGGGQTHIDNLSASMNAGGHTVALATGTPGALSDIFARRGFDTFTIPTLDRGWNPLRDLRAAFALRRTIRRFGADLVVTHSRKAGVVGRVAALLAGVPCVVTVHGSPFTEGMPKAHRFLYRAVERPFAPLAARIINVSAYDQRLGEAAGIAQHKQVLVRNGVPDLRFPVASSLDPRVSPGMVRAIMIARFDIPKDQALLVRAAKGIPNLHLDLVGDGPMLEDVRTLVNDLAMTHRVTFYGTRPDVPNLLAGADIFALISRYEGFPLTTLEAMRAGVPAVVSRVGGAAESMVEGTTGFLVPRDDVLRLRACLSFLASRPQQRRAMGRAARAHYEANYTQERVVRETLAVYTQSLATPSPMELTSFGVKEGHRGV